MIRIIVASLILIAPLLKAAETPASKESIQELLQITNARNLLDSMLPQIESAMRAGTQQATRGRTLTAEEQRIADSMYAKVTASIKAELTWEKLEPIYVEIYQKSFTQEELAGIIAFYKTPAGAALIKKMPVVMQQSMIAMQQLMGPVMQRVEGSIKETAAEIEAQKQRK